MRYLTTAGAPHTSGLYFSAHLDLVLHGILEGELKAVSTVSISQHAPAVSISSTSQYQSVPVSIDMSVPVSTSQY